MSLYLLSLLLSIIFLCYTACCYVDCRYAECPVVFLVLTWLPDTVWVGHIRTNPAKAKIFLGKIHSLFFIKLPQFMEMNHNFHSNEMVYLTIKSEKLYSKKFYKIGPWIFVTILAKPGCFAIYDCKFVYKIDRSN